MIRAGIVKRGVAHPACRWSAFLSPTAPLATRSFAAKSFVRKDRAACDSGLDLERLSTSVGQAPVHRVPRPSFERLRIGERASLSQGRLSTSANETYSVRAHPRDRLRARLKTPSFSRSVKSPCVCQSRTPVRLSPGLRAVGSAPWRYNRSGFASIAPAVLWAYC